jgi:ABC-type nitrate/sulfonate/bicarbonate transport system substrate-binding protein
VLEWWLRTRVYLAAVSCLLLSINIAAPVAFAVDNLRVSYASVTGNTAVITYIAQRAGLFEKQGLDVEIILITGGPAAVSAL